MKTNLTDTCPHCKQKTLQYSQNADILYKVSNGRLIPQLQESNIGWMDATYLYCTNCAADEDSSTEMNQLKREYDNHI